MQRTNVGAFSPDIPPNLEHAGLIREEAFEWLGTHYGDRQTFGGADVLRMAGERERR